MQAASDTSCRRKVAIRTIWLSSRSLPESKWVSTWFASFRIESALDARSSPAVFSHTLRPLRTVTLRPSRRSTSLKRWLIADWVTPSAAAAAVTEWW